jgi:hypothetical protein
MCLCCWLSCVLFSPRYFLLMFLYQVRTVSGHICVLEVSILNYLCSVCPWFPFYDRLNIQRNCWNEPHLPFDDLKLTEYLRWRRNKMHLVVYSMVFNATFNNISAISWRSVYWWRKPEDRWKTTDLSQVTDFIT